MFSSVNRFEFDKTRFRRYIGNIGEMVVQEILLKEGFQVWLITPYHPSSHKNRPLRSGLITILAYLYRDTLGEDTGEFSRYGSNMMREYEKHAIELKDFLDDRLESLKKYLEKLGAIGKSGIHAGFRFVKKIDENEYLYCPDLIAKKNNEIFVVEVKVGQGINYLKGKSRKGLILAKDYGFIPMLITLDIDIKASNFRMKTF
jgi:hypothetical protein